MFVDMDVCCFLVSVMLLVFFLHVVVQPCCSE